MADSLLTLAERYGTDKVTVHSYILIYEQYLESRRKSVLEFLEIGVLYGESLRMWRDYFPNAQIHGIDIEDKEGLDRNTRIHIYQFDQTDHLAASRSGLATHQPSSSWRANNEC